MSTNIRLEFIEPSAREVEGKEFFELRRFFEFLPSSPRPPRSSLSARVKNINTSLPDGSSKLQTKISGSAA